MKFITSIAALTTIALSTVSAQSGSYTNFINCYGNNTVAQVNVTSAAFTPAPMCVGEEYCFEVTGTSKVPITQGAKLYELGIAGSRPQPIGGQTDLCALLAASGQPCPIPAGPIALKVCYKNKTVFQHITLTWMFNAFSADDKPLFCQQTAAGPAPEPTPENPRGVRGLFARNCTAPLIEQS
ncbi:hypothetical protein BGZ95_005032 [Linnemannia exigua]|uniref:Phosphatidylglycerol/phosphatidylinositol transfer protein n=1 Tax=Linnemannia exigua TaxID=604196 RepID=A0AAD4H9Y2_9FUNG|nr:hypothetical protein BGZ95_005032 [Linnemannia exigua]